ncbi:complex I 51 kDa subunit family protein [Candidatus Xianfuyuplasma coldseepsis]|uniref:NADH-quinone oxidoreductase subunit F n=1 Tax=Candidatus Xianfuyuplasma coldseepsis TaxID=2782163 RepID=A0A7L7KRP2_9MOLU|nr:NADH-ubiquinone oxidoreductase-F iron-sulfur binding region domain-containing protein [Xianfuyuplasma coldseepsis]QMS85491.1 NADH-quinone oxidoreductase subunit F [Xianfuyuplasma coldseepsis]
MVERRELTKRFDQINPEQIQDFLALDGFSMLEKALKMTPSEVRDEIRASRLTGRGGAGFLTSIKMDSFAAETGKKYIVCNADEGEPGNFKDRYLMEKDPFQVIEGMCISAYATGAQEGFIYIRGEYQTSIKRIQNAIDESRKHHYLGTHILQSAFSFDITIRQGAGAYVCGEEFALIESLEGKPGRTRVKPPYPAQEGYFSYPTLINNVETFCNLPFIVRIGGDAYRQIGSDFASGTKLISLSGNVKHKGLYEVPYGTTIRDVIFKLGGGTPNHRAIKMVQLGGACGAIIPDELLDMDIDNERFQIFDSKMGAGAIIVMDDSHDLFDIIHRNMEFFAHESCGKCTPCREGHIQLVKLIEKFIINEASQKDYDTLRSLAQVIHDTTLCGLGQTSPTCILSTMEFFPEEYNRRIAYRKRGGQA